MDVEGMRAAAREAERTEEGVDDKDRMDMDTD